VEWIKTAVCSQEVFLLDKTKTLRLGLGLGLGLRVPVGIGVGHVERNGTET
jgi:hypothetical protein